MRELDVNTTQKISIEDDRLQSELSKLSRSARRTTNQISKTQKRLTENFLDITCRIDKVTDDRKRNSFKVMKSGRPRPVSAIHIPSADSDMSVDQFPVFKDRLGRPALDMERMNRERLDRFYHNKIDTLMTRMEQKTKKGRTRSAPVRRPGSAIRSMVTVPGPAESIDINNIPDVIPEYKPVSRSDAEFQLKKMRSTLEKHPSLLYGEAKEDTLIRKQYNPDSIPDLRRRRSSTFNSTTPPVMSRSSSRALIKSPVDDDDLSDISEYEDQALLERTNFLHRRNTFKAHPQYGRPRPATTIGIKIQQYQDKRYPSKFLHPNPDLYARQIPFPEIVDRDAYIAFCRRVAQVKTVTEMRNDLQSLLARNEMQHHKPIHAWDHGPQFKT